MSSDQQELFKKIDQECDWELNDGEFNELQAIGSPAPASDIIVFQVSTFADNTVLGCGGHARNRPACTIAAREGAWDTAHEVCHVLLGSTFAPVACYSGVLTSAAKPSRLMASSDIRLAWL